MVTTISFSGLVKSYKAKQYDAEHPLVVGHCKSYNFFMRNKENVLAQVSTYDILSYLRVKPAILNFLQMTTAQDVETSVTVNNNSSIQVYVHPDDQTQPTREMTPGLKPFTSGGSRGGIGPGARPAPPLFLDQTEAQRAKKEFFWRPGPPLSQGLNYPPPPPFYLKVWIRHCSQYLSFVC